jgi:hypothetical protein
VITLGSIFDRWANRPLPPVGVDMWSCQWCDGVTGGEWSDKWLFGSKMAVSPPLALLTMPSLPPIHSRLWTNVQWPDGWAGVLMLGVWIYLNLLSLMNALSVVSAWSSLLFVSWDGKRHFAECAFQSSHAAHESYEVFSWFWVSYRLHDQHLYKWYTSRAVRSSYWVWSPDHDSSLIFYWLMVL